MLKRFVWIRVCDNMSGVYIYECEKFMYFSSYEWLPLRERITFSLWTRVLQVLLGVHFKNKSSETRFFFTLSLSLVTNFSCVLHREQEQKKNASAFYAQFFLPSQFASESVCSLCEYTNEHGVEMREAEHGENWTLDFY